MTDLKAKKIFISILALVLTCILVFFIFYLKISNTSRNPAQINSLNYSQIFSKALITEKDGFFYYTLNDTAPLELLCDELDSEPNVKFNFFATGIRINGDEPIMISSSVPCDALFSETVILPKLLCKKNVSYLPEYKGSTQFLYGNLYLIGGIHTGSWNLNSVSLKTKSGGVKTFSLSDDFIKFNKIDCSVKSF